MLRSRLAVLVMLAGCTCGQSEAAVPPTLAATAPDASVVAPAPSFDPLLDAGPGGRVVLDAGPDLGVTDAGQVLDAGHPLRFVAVGDTGKGNQGQRDVGASIGRLCAKEGCDFVVLLGDNFYQSGVSSTSDPQWKTAFIEPYATVEAPFYAVLGNHDYGANGAGTDLPKGDHQVRYSEVNKKWRMPARHYHWREGDVELFAADTNRSMFRVDQQVRADFDRWLPASTAHWKLVFGHHPLRSNGPHGNAGRYDGLPFAPFANGEGVRRFVEDRVCGRADVYFAGHDHNLQWLESTCTSAGSNINTELIVSGAGAATTKLMGSNRVHYQSDELGFVYVVVAADDLVITFFDGAGVAKFTRTVHKP